MGLERRQLVRDPAEVVDDAVDVLIVEAESGHPQLVERRQHAAFVEDARVVQLGAEPTELRRVRDIADEREVEAGDELAPFLREIGADRLRLLEALDVVTAEAAIAADRATSEL